MLLISFIGGPMVKLSFTHADPAREFLGTTTKEFVPCPET
jgi:hypothetical protein